jgi:hypothetical protein
MGTRQRLDGNAWLQGQLSGLSREVRVALGETLLSGDVDERLGGIICDRLDGIQAVQEAVTRRVTPDGTKRPHGLRAGLGRLKRATDALHVLHQEMRGDPVDPNEPLLFKRVR